MLWVKYGMFSSYMTQPPDSPKGHTRQQQQLRSPRCYGRRCAHNPPIACGRPVSSSPAGKFRAGRFDGVDDQEDRPLITQFCGNDPDTVVRAARHVEHKCDAVDLNLGCPQNIAKKGNYGAFLLPNPQLCEDIVSAMSRYCCMRIYALFIERRLVQALLPRRQLVELALFVREWKRECRSHCRRTRFAKREVICFGLMQPCSPLRQYFCR